MYVVCVCQRCDIINGDVQPTDSDCQWSTDESDTEVYDACTSILAFILAYRVPFTVGWATEKGLKSIQLSPELHRPVWVPGL